MTSSRNIFSIDQGHVIRVPGAGFQISRWIDTGERPEIMNKMRLIEVAGIQGDIRPFDLRTRSHTLERSLEAIYAAEKFGRQADLAIEELYEMAETESRSFRHVRDATSKRCRLKLAESEVDSRMYG